jgi:hypothetical protein
MEPSRETMLKADLLIRALGNGAEEHAAGKMWRARHVNDERSASRWLSMLEALKLVREIRANI